MRSALTSINPPNTDNIFDGVKSIEWRTKPLPTGLHYCYETKNMGGAGKVIGEFTVWAVRRYERAEFIPETSIDLGSVPKEFLMEYSKGKPIYANYIAKPKRYDNPIELSEFTGLRKTKFGYEPIKITRPPQSWCYVEKGGAE